MTWRCCGESSARESPAPSSARAGGSRWTPSSAAPSRPCRGILGSSPRWRRSCSTASTRMRLDTTTTLLTATTPSGGVKLWLFVAYVVSFVCLAGAVGLLVQDALTDKGPSVWTGVAGVLQCVLVLISGLIYWTCHSED